MSAQPFQQADAPVFRNLAAAAAWAEHEAEEMAEDTLSRDDLTTLVADHDEHALLDLLLDAHRFGTDTQQPFKDLMTALKADLVKLYTERLKRQYGVPL